MQARRGSLALQNGLLYGVILGIVEIALSFLLGGVGLILNFLLFLFLTGYAGYRASGRTGKVSTGLVAGLFAGLVSSVIACIPLLLYYLTNIDSFRAQLQQQMQASNLYQGFTLTNNLVIVTVILLLVLIVAGATLIGLGIGSIGGAIGKGRAQADQSAMGTINRPLQGGQAQPPSYMPPYPQQGFVPPPPQESKPFYPQGDYTSPEAYRLPQENPPQSPKDAGPFVSQE